MDDIDRVLIEAWNRFVTVMSGGLLYGREVERAGAGGQGAV